MMNDQKTVDFLNELIADPLSYTIVSSGTKYTVFESDTYGTVSVENSLLRSKGIDEMSFIRQ
jgi:hypothetical protein